VARAKATEINRAAQEPIVINDEGKQNTSTIATSTTVRVLGYRLDALTVGYQADLDTGTLRWLRAAHDQANGLVPYKPSRDSSIGNFDADVEADLRDTEAALNQAGPGRVPQVPFSVGPFLFALDARRARGAFILKNGDCTVLVGLEKNRWDVEIKWDAVTLATKGHAACLRIGRDIVVHCARCRRR
jgi:hypothetical protein